MLNKNSTKNSDIIKAEGSVFLKPKAAMRRVVRVDAGVFVLECGHRQRDDGMSFGRTPKSVKCRSCQA